jgi:KUP system potassium uptake protein
VLIFKSSDSLAGAYGFAVSATMLLTTLSFCLVGHYVWQWNKFVLGGFLILTLPLDFAFLAASIDKIPNGGYVTALVSLLAFWLMSAWIRGNQFLSKQAPRSGQSVDEWQSDLLKRDDLINMPKPAVFFQHLHIHNYGQHLIPVALLRQVQLTSAFFQPSVIIQFRALHIPVAEDAEKVRIDYLTPQILLATLTFGFTENPSLDPLIPVGKTMGLWKEADEITYFSVAERFRASKESKLSPWVRYPFIYLHQFDQRIVDRLALPSHQYAELGTIIEV